MRFIPKNSVRVEVRGRALQPHSLYMKSAARNADAYSLVRLRLASHERIIFSLNLFRVGVHKGTPENKNALLDEGVYLYQIATGQNLRCRMD